MNYID